MRSILFVCLLLTACGGGKPPVAEDPGLADAQIYEVFGMDCPGCHGGLEKLVEKVPGVAQATASWRHQRLIVVPEPGAQVDPAAVEDAVRRANFTPGERRDP